MSDLLPEFTIFSAKSEKKTLCTNICPRLLQTKVWKKIFIVEWSVSKNDKSAFEVIFIFIYSHGPSKSNGSFNSSMNMRLLLESKTYPKRSAIFMIYWYILGGDLDLSMGFQKKPSLEDTGVPAYM